MAAVPPGPVFRASSLPWAAADRPAIIGKVSSNSSEPSLGPRHMRSWFANVIQAIKTVAEGMYITLWYFLQTFRRRTYTERFEYPELPVPVRPRYRGFHRFDLTTCIGCDKCARACPVDCIY